MEEKPRHGCLTAWLIMLIIVNSLISLLYFFVDISTLNPNVKDLPPVTKILFGILSLINIAFAFALLNWKKWGYYGFFVSSIMMFFTNVNFGMPPSNAIVSFVGISLLFLILQIKKDGKSGWEQLE
jgi:hypothetical protein